MLLIGALGVVALGTRIFAKPFSPYTRDSTVINATDLSKVFLDGARECRAVDGVSFTVPAGKLFTLLGPSGCGKTTTLRCIAGLETPSSGEIAIGKKPSVRREAGHVGVAQQAPHRYGFPVLRHLAAHDGISECLLSAEEQRHLLAPRGEGPRAQRARERWGSWSSKIRPAPRVLRRPAAAGGVWRGPWRAIRKCLLLDEPLSNLDAKLREEMRSGIRSLQKRIQITSLYVTHDQIEALTISDQIAVMHAGKIVEIGRPRDIYLRPKTRFAANFIGLTNIIPGQVMGEGGGATYRPSARLARSFAAGLEPASTSSDRVLVLVRPESLRLSSLSPGSRAKYRGAAS